MSAFTVNEYKFLMRNARISEFKLQKAFSQLFIERSNDLYNKVALRELNMLLMSHVGNFDDLLNIIEVGILSHHSFALVDHALIMTLECAIETAGEIYDGLLVITPESQNIN